MRKKERIFRSFFQLYSPAASEVRRWRSYEMLRIVMDATRVMMLAERAVMSGDATL